MSSADDYPWAYYADLQRRSSELTRLSPTWWGLEAGMDHLLDAIATGTVPADPAELAVKLERIIGSAARLQRSRAASLKSNAPIDELPIAGDAAADARIEMKRVLRLVSSKDRRILIDTGVGFSDREIAGRRNLTPGAVRARLSRVRSRIAA